MPSASSKTQAAPQTQAPSADLLQEPLKSALSIADKKLRNLEKRRLKLLETKKKADQGDKLNDDQKNALKSLESVDFGLEAVKDVQKSLVALEQEYIKLSKKDQKRQKQEQKDKLEGQSQKLVFDVVEVQAILGELSEEVRPDFLAGSNGACKLEEADLEKLDSIYELINPATDEDKSQKLSERTKTAGQHLVSLVESKTTPAVEGVTYKDINEILQKIKGCGYFDKETINGDNVEEVAEQQPVEEEQKPDEPAVIESPEEEYPAEQPVENAPTIPVNGVDLPPEVQETSEEEGIKFMGESEISVAPDAALNPVSPEFVPRKMQSQSDEGGFDNGDNDWQNVESGHSHHGGNYRGRGGRARGGGNYRGRGSRGGNGGNYRGGNRGEGTYRGRGGNRGTGGNYRGNREGGRGNYRGNRDGDYRGSRGGNRGGRGGGQQQQQQQ